MRCTRPVCRLEAVNDYAHDGSSCNGDQRADETVFKIFPHGARSPVMRPLVYAFTPEDEGPFRGNRHSDSIDVLALYGLCSAPGGRHERTPPS